MQPRATAADLFVVIAAGTANGVSTNLVSIGRMAGGQQTRRINLTPWTTAIAAMLSHTGKAGDLDPARDNTAINGSLTVVITLPRPGPSL